MVLPWTLPGGRQAGRTRNRIAMIAQVNGEGLPSNVGWVESSKTHRPAPVRGPRPGGGGERGGGGARGVPSRGVFEDSPHPTCCNLRKLRSNVGWVESSKTHRASPAM